MKKYLGIFTVILLLFILVSPTNAVDLKTGINYGTLVREGGKPDWAKGATTAMHVLSVEKDTTGTVKFRIIEELGYLEYGLENELEGKILTAMTFGMFPVYSDAVWVGLGSGLYSYLRTDIEDIKALAFGLRTQATWKRMRIGFGADAISLDKADDYYVHGSLGLTFK